jgi:BirA family transcriptional regulator, biotin operon repressor / biotin---[acetyl-CoA-carboxylase] ligase
MRTDDHTQGLRAPISRKALDTTALRRSVLRPGGLWREIEVKALTGSTNADLLVRAAAGAPEGLVAAAEEQAAGRGRRGRAWVSPPRAALTFSLLVRPEAVPPARRGWLPLLAGVAAAEAVRTAAGVDAKLKWPNDLLAPGPDASEAAPGKLGGILAEAAGNAVVVGIGINVSTGPHELPPACGNATSLRIAGAASLDRERLLAAILAGFERWYEPWRQAAGDPERSGLHPAYTRLCDTFGRRVRVELPGGQPLSGVAAGVDPGGRLLVRVSSGADVPVAAGDVVHVR